MKLRVCVVKTTTVVHWLEMKEDSSSWLGPFCVEFACSPSIRVDILWVLCGFSHSL